MKEILDILRNKENERLKMDIRYWEDKWQYTKFSDKDYKSRIDKAIEYIKERYESVLKDEHFLDHDDLVDRRIALHLLNILGGKNE